MMNLPCGELQPPSASFPGSSLQARGGRVLLHVSPEMSHTCTQARVPHRVSFPTADAHNLLCMSPRTRARIQYKRSHGVPPPPVVCICVCVCLASCLMGVAPCVCECVMRCVMWRRYGCLLLETCLMLPQGTQRRLIIS